VDFGALLRSNIREPEKRESTAESLFLLRAWSRYGTDGTIQSAANKNEELRRRPTWSDVSQAKEEASASSYDSGYDAGYERASRKVDKVGRAALGSREHLHLQRPLRPRQALA